ncbi:MAG: hypothetical protein MZW92_76155 [Comamonadaceae bacterium]|nr:hypothetical protein [Comamonadaceae bacterium]
MTEETKFLLQITSPDSETILMRTMRYLPNVNREIMNTHIDAAREVIQEITAKSYGWDKVAKEVREDVQLGKPDRR